MSCKWLGRQLEKLFSLKSVRARGTTRLQDILNILNEPLYERVNTFPASVFLSVTSRACCCVVSWIKSMPECVSAHRRRLVSETTPLERWWSARAPRHDVKVLTRSSAATLFYTCWTVFLSFCCRMRLHSRLYTKLDNWTWAEAAEWLKSSGSHSVASCNCSVNEQSLPSPCTHSHTCSLLCLFTPQNTRFTSLNI